MPTTDSTPTAMRWWCSDARRRRSLALACMLTLPAGACTRYTEYEIPGGEARMSLDELRQEADMMLRAHCPRLMGTGASATGEASVRLVVARDGAVRRSRVTRSSGDEQVDQMFGTLAAHLQFSPQPDMRGNGMNATMLAGYSCGADLATSTVNVLGLEIPKAAPVSPTP